IFLQVIPAELNAVFSAPLCCRFSLISGNAHRHEQLFIPFLCHLCPPFFWPGLRNTGARRTGCRYSSIRNAGTSPLPGRSCPGTAADVPAFPVSVSNAVATVSRLRV